VHGTVRQYQGIDPGTYGEVARRQADIEALLRGVPGFVAYDMLRPSDTTMTTVTICEDQAGAEEANRRVAAWIKANIPTFMPSPPQISLGEVVLHFSR
jgi:antibiotic biosynthesis monooxygenase (ABM) superfamily enzyme